MANEYLHVIVAALSVGAACPGRQTVWLYPAEFRSRSTLRLGTQRDELRAVSGNSCGWAPSPSPQGPIRSGSKPYPDAAAGCSEPSGNHRLPGQGRLIENVWSRTGVTREAPARRPGLTGRPDDQRLVLSEDRSGIARQTYSVTSRDRR